MISFDTDLGARAVAGKSRSNTHLFKINISFGEEGPNLFTAQAGIEAHDCGVWIMTHLEVDNTAL